MNKIDENKNDSEKIKVSIFDNLIKSIALNKDNIKIKGVTREYQKAFELFARL